MVFGRMGDWAFLSNYSCWWKIRGRAMARAALVVIACFLAVGSPVTSSVKVKAENMLASDILDQRVRRHSPSYGSPMLNISHKPHASGHLMERIGTFGGVERSRPLSPGGGMIRPAGVGNSPPAGYSIQGARSFGGLFRIPCRYQGHLTVIEYDTLLAFALQAPMVETRIS